jgi:hypothetical protein
MVEIEEDIEKGPELQAQTQVPALLTRYILSS